MSALSAPTEPLTYSVNTSKKSSVKPLYLLLLLAVIGSAIATSYLLVSGNTPQLIPAPTPLQTAQENPFTDIETVENTNPLTEENFAAAEVASNPFASSSAESNFFAQFETNESGPAAEYTNPF